MEDFEKDILDQDKDKAPAQGIFVTLIVAVCVYGGVWFVLELVK